MQRNTQAHSCNHCCSGKAVIHILGVCLLTQVSSKQCACNIFLSVAWFYNIFPHYLINGMIFKKKLLNMKCLF